MDKPTCEQMMEEDGLRQVHRAADDSWRHGAYIYQVFHRESDNTYWSAHYRLSSDGETHELAEGLAKIQQVVPKQTIMVTYVPADALEREGDS